MVSRSTIALVCVGVYAVGSLACSPDVERSKREYVERGDRYLTEKNVDAAIIEYRNAIQQDPRFAAVYRKLSAAHLSRGEGAEALRTALIAADLMPDAAEPQLEAGDLLLLAGRFDDARGRAQKALAKDSNSTRAHVLLGNATAGLKDMDSAIEEFEEAIRLDPLQSGIYTGLAVVTALKGDRAAAETIFQKAIATDLKSATARLALAQFYWSSERLADAERTLLEARTAIPDDQRVNVSLAVFYQATRRGAEAEPYLKAAANANPNARVTLLLADYYIARNRGREAAPLLEPMTTDRRFGALASLRLAGIAQMDGRPDDALVIIDKALAAEPKHALALATKSDLLRQQRRFDDAAEAADAAIAANPSSAEAQFVRGRALLAKGQLDKAEKAFADVVRLNPRATAARVELARLRLRADADDAVLLATQATQAAPGNLDARLTLARALAQKQEYPQAERILEELLRLAPGVAPIHAQMGSLLARKRDLEGARTAFTRSLELDPFQLEALQGLTAIDFNADRQSEAVLRLEALLQREPTNTGVLMIAAQAYATRKDFADAERLLVKVTELDPVMLKAYSMLGRVYLAQKRLGAARVQFEKVAASDERPVAALTVIGMIDLLENRIADAQKSFERVMRIDPRAPVAANNLAWIYSEHGGSLDVALQLAQVAHTALPNEPEVNDTLGWVYYKKGRMPLAITSLRRGLELDPKNAEAAYHLALALQKSGDRTEARRVLTLYLTLDSTSPRSADVRKRLEALGT